MGHVPADYVDVVRGIDREARTLEAAMQIEAQMARVVEAVGGTEAAPGDHLTPRQVRSKVGRDG
jgi:hypothetical protein